MAFNKFNVFSKLNRGLIIAGICFLIMAVIFFQQFFVKNLNIKIASCEQEQELLTEKFNNKIEKLSKQLVVIKEENSNIKIYNQDLEHKIEELKYTQHDMDKKLYQINKQKDELAKNHLSVGTLLQNKIKNLRKENADLHALIQELQLQIKNYKINSYGLFQAGKLEIELSNLDQQLSEQYENIHQKKSNIGVLKDKCGTLRTNTKFCKEYDAALTSIGLLENQLKHLQSKREDLKHRINVYLSSSTQTNPH